jgi:hypothetical protein
MSFRAAMPAPVFVINILMPMMWKSIADSASGFRQVVKLKCESHAVR